MSAGSDAVRDFVQDRACTFLGNAGNFWGAIRHLAGDDIEDYSEEGRQIAGAFGQMYRGICNREPPEPDRAGGFCGIPYGIRITTKFFFLNGTFAFEETLVTDVNFQPFMYGPIGGAYLVTDGGFLRFRVNGFDALGAPQNADITSQVGELVYRTPAIQSLEFFPFPPAVENCSPVPIPPTEVTYPQPQPSGDITYVDNGDNIINIPVGVVIEAPSLDIRGNIRIPVRLDLGGNTLNLSPQITIDLSSEGGGTIVPSPLPRPDWRDRRPIERIVNDRGGDILPPDEELPYPDFPPQSARGVMLGVVVVASSAGENSLSIIFQDNNPDIVVPSLGHVAFTYSIGGRICWSEDIRVKNARQFIPCPLPTRAVGVEGTGQPGVELKLFPVFQPIEAFYGYDLTNA